MQEVIALNRQELYNTLQLINRTGDVAFDTETTSLDQDKIEITGVSFSDGDISIYAPINSSKNVKRARCVSKEEAVIAIKEFLSTFKGTLVAHNWVFDARVFRKIGIKIDGYDKVCTAVADHLIDERRSHKLKDLVENILGLEVVRFDEVGEDHYTEEFYKYGLADAINTWLLWQEQKPLIEKDNKLSNLFYKVEMPFQEVLLEMALEGILIDQELIKTASKKLHKELNECLFNMCEIAGVKYEVLDDEEGTIKPYTERWVEFKRKPTELRRTEFKFSTKTLTKIFQELEIPIKGRTPKGEPSISKETIQALIAKDNDGNKVYRHEFVKHLHKYKVVSQLINLFFSKLPGFIQADGKVRPNIMDTGTSTGRMSCSKPNIQQLASPNDLVDVNVREAFIAPPGYKMFSCDYSGQEVAVAAQQSRDPTLIKALKNGYDMHLAVANNSFNLGIPEECLSKKHPDYEKWKNKFKKERSQAKAITFGLMYGKSSYGFAKDFGVEEDEAQEMIDNYFNGMPMLKKAIDDTHKELDRDGYITNLAGRKRHFDKGYDGHYEPGAYRQSFNFKIQGFSADMIRSAMVTVYKNKKKHLEWGLKTVMTVHDEAVYIVREEYVEEAASFVKKCFENVCKRFVVPVKADVEIGDNYGNSK